MKKTIFYTIKSVQENCITFSQLLYMGFSGFFWTNTSYKKLVFYGTLLLLGFGFMPNSFGQDVGSSVVKANFGVDGDAYSGKLQFPNVAGIPFLVDPKITDDWFNGPDGGKGVIDETGANPRSEAIAPASSNTAFQLRQSQFAPTSPYPYPVVDGYLWLDAVYGRDNYVKGGSAEKSYFAGSGDKNSDNPNTWQIGTAGSVPQKDDIIDVYAHLRGEGLRPGYATDTINPRPFDDLWAFAGASLVVTNGNKHLDFEFFRTALEKPADLNDNTKLGPDGGRTAWTFDPGTGKVITPGTIIVSVDYINGGNVPTIRIRVWMDQTTFNNYNNSLGGAPF